MTSRPLISKPDLDDNGPLTMKLPIIVKDRKFKSKLKNNKNNIKTGKYDHRIIPFEYMYYSRERVMIYV